MTVKRQKRRYREARRLGVVRDRAEFDVLSASATAVGRIDHADLDQRGLVVTDWETAAQAMGMVRPEPVAPDRPMAELLNELVEAWASACGMSAQLLAPTLPAGRARPTPRGQPG